MGLVWLAAPVVTPPMATQSPESASNAMYPAEPVTIEASLGTCMIALHARVAILTNHRTEDATVLALEVTTLNHQLSAEHAHPHVLIATEQLLTAHLACPLPLHLMSMRTSASSLALQAQSS